MFSLLNHDRSILRRVILPAAVSLIVASGTPDAGAHTISTGLGPFCDGAAHWALSPADLLSAIALAMLAGLRGTRCGRLLLAIFPAGWLLGGFGGMLSPVALHSGLVTGASFFLLGALVAADSNLPLPAVTALAALTGLIYGTMTGSELTRQLSNVWALLGAATALIIVTALVIGIVTSLRAFWARIIMRVLGSWIAASGLLMLGWVLHHRR